MAKTIKTLGARACILSTDYFFESSPAEPEMFRMLVSSLMEEGVSEEEIKIMVKENPSSLLSL
jgi:hypothetical protein